jgi:hypothetical protein
MKKAMVIVTVTFFFVFEKKKTMAMRHHLPLWFCCTKEGDGNKLRSPSLLQ